MLFSIQKCLLNNTGFPKYDNSVLPTEGGSAVELKGMMQKQRAPGIPQVLHMNRRRQAPTESPAFCVSAGTVKAWGQAGRRAARIGACTSCGL